MQRGSSRASAKTKMRASLINSTKENPGSDLGRARAKSGFDWDQSYEQNINFPVASQA
jgi:hypothetical protein